MKILIESDKDIAELHIKFSDGVANVESTTSPIAKKTTDKAIENPNRKPLLSDFRGEEVVNNQVIPETQKQARNAKKAPIIDIPTVDNRPPKVDENMGENF